MLPQAASGNSGAAFFEKLETLINEDFCSLARRERFLSGEIF